MVGSMFRKLLTKLGQQTEDAECKLMGAIYNFVNLVLIISCVGKYHPKTSNRHTGYLYDKPVLIYVLKSKGRYNKCKR